MISVSATIQWARSGVGVLGALDKVSLAITLVETTLATAYMLSNLGLNDFSTLGESYRNERNPRFEYAMSQEGNIDAVVSFKQNLRRIMKNVKTHKKEQLARLMSNRNSSLVFYIPTPENNPLHQVTVPAPFKITIPGKGKRNVVLAFGKPGGGRYFGIGCKVCTSGGSTKPKQWFRMDWHEPHPGAGTKDHDYWIKGFWHFHVLKRG